MGVITRGFVLSNQIECLFWLILSAGFVAAWWRRGSPDLAIAALALAAFGVSDWVETNTGAWWRPWWLLAWKGGCVMVFLVLLYRYRRRGKH